MPRPLPPVALPGPQIFFRVPKSPGFAWAELVVVGAGVLPLLFPPPPEREHAAPVAVMVAAMAPTAISRALRFFTPRLTAPCAFVSAMGRRRRKPQQGGM